ncbi:universal stress protein [Gordonia hydrophobica]|uniref:Universal stress protein n=1 Tax=Gordonia hydrophobica TaxID=40516 RepID=A0ABZ2U7K8_9ACTN|nr:universal stress protein [Gordonia hydrophobica]MBM7368681.1 nucleotide-binding universal stress UspA family protein [Gordonia hydrophobica]
MTVHSAVSVAVDGSDQALEAVQWAAAAAQRLQRRLDVVSVVPPVAMPFGPLSLQSDEDAMLAARQKAETAVSVAAQVAVRTANVPVETRVIEGKPALALRAVSTRAHMLVVGRRGLGGVRGLLLGSVSTDVAAHGDCPTVVVPAGGDRTTGPVVVGFDGSPSADAALERAFDAASTMKTSLTVVHGYGGFTDEVFHGYSGQVLENLRGNAEIAVATRIAGHSERLPDVEVTIDLTTEPPAEHLSVLSETAQLVVVGTRGRGGFRGLTLGSTSQALLHVAQSPVMVVQNR